MYEAWKLDQSNVEVLECKRKCLRQGRTKRLWSTLGGLRWGRPFNENFKCSVMSKPESDENVILCKNGRKAWGWKIFLLAGRWCGTRLLCHHQSFSKWNLSALPCCQSIVSWSNTNVKSSTFSAGEFFLATACLSWGAWWGQQCRNQPPPTTTSDPSNLIEKIKRKNYNNKTTSRSIQHNRKKTASNQPQSKW